MIEWTRADVRRVEEAHAGGEGRDHRTVLVGRTRRGRVASRNGRHHQVLVALPFVVLEHRRYRQPDRVHPSQTLAFVEQGSSGSVERARFQKHCRPVRPVEAQDRRAGFAGADVRP